MCWCYVAVIIGVLVAAAFSGWRYVGGISCAFRFCLGCGIDCCGFGCCGGSWVVCCGVGFCLRGCDGGFVSWLACVFDWRWYGGWVVFGWLGGWVVFG